MATNQMAGPRTAGRLNTFVAGVVGAVFIVVGLLGYTVSGDHALAGHTGGQLLGLFQVNSLHNMVHIAVGAAMVAAAIAGARAARTVNLGIGAVYLLLGVAGLFITGDNPLNVIALNGADNGLHLVIGSALIGGRPGRQALSCLRGGFAVARPDGTCELRRGRGDRSASDGIQAPAATLARTWSAEVAPAMTEATVGCAARPPMATSNMDSERSSAYRSTASMPVPRRLLEPAGPPRQREPAAGRRRLVPVVLAGEQAAGEREVRQQADAEPLAGRDGRRPRRRGRAASTRSGR